jgi:hypothetical protein
MDPITAAISIAGLGMKLFGAGGALGAGMSASGFASQETAVSQNTTQLQIQENQQRQLAMQISARRQNMQNVRATQLAQSQGQEAAVNQGAQFTSGAAGGYAQAAGQGGVNLLGTNQNLQIGNALFGIQNQISQNQITMAGLQGQQSSAQGTAAMFGGIASIGGALAGSAGPMGSILGNFFGNKNDPSLGTGGQGLPQGAATGGLY